MIGLRKRKRAPTILSGIWSRRARKKNIDYDNYTYYRVQWNMGIEYGSDAFFTRKEAREFKKSMQGRDYEARIFKYEVSSGYYINHGEVF